MGIDKATLDRYIADVAGDDQELATMLRERLGTKEEAATRFVGGFMRNQDYTKKTQELAQQRQQAESLAQDYEARLTQAEQEKNKIMRDLAEARISGSRAAILLNSVKQAYGLTDNDLPGVEDVKATERTGNVVDSTPDLDQRIQGLEERIMKQVTEKLIPEISSLAVLTPVWNDISYEHERLFGKRLGKKEQTEILQEARTQNKSLEQIWQDKYNVADRRLEVRDQDNKTKWKREWEDEQAKRNQDEALAGVRNATRDPLLEDRQSPLFKRNFMPQPEVDHTDGSGIRQTPAPVRTDAQAERLSGAERAAAKFIERSRNGQLGKPLEKAS